MNQKDARTYFDEWLSAYCDRLHVVRKGTGIDLAQPTAPNPPLAVPSEKSKDAPRKSTA